jgi:hypothetical protein
MHNTFSCYTHVWEVVSSTISATGSQTKKILHGMAALPCLSEKISTRWPRRFTSRNRNWMKYDLLQGKRLPIWPYGLPLHCPSTSWWHRDLVDDCLLRVKCGDLIGPWTQDDGLDVTEHWACSSLVLTSTGLDFTLALWPVVGKPC